MHVYDIFFLISLFKKKKPEYLVCHLLMQFLFVARRNLHSLSNVSNFTFTSQPQLLHNVYLYLVRHVKIHKNKSLPFTWKTNVCVFNTNLFITLISTFHQPTYANYSYLSTAVTVFTAKCFKLLCTYCTYFFFFWGETSPLCWTKLQYDIYIITNTTNLVVFVTITLPYCNTVHTF